MKWSVRSVAFSPDSKILASSGCKILDHESVTNAIRLWDLESGKELHKLEGHDSSINSLAFSSDGKTLASGSDDETVRLWNVTTGRQLSLPPAKPGAYLL